MVDLTEVPYISYSKKAFLPKYFSQYNKTFVYDLFSPINGSEIKRGENYLCVDLELIIPIGVLCYLKAIHFEENGQYNKDERLDRGLVKMVDGQNHALTFKIPKLMSTLHLRRGDKIGSLIFDRAIVFKPFHIMSEYSTQKVLTKKFFY